MPKRTAAVGINTGERRRAKRPDTVNARIKIGRSTSKRTSDATGCVAIQPAVLDCTIPQTVTVRPICNHIKRPKDDAKETQPSWV